MLETSSTNTEIIDINYNYSNKFYNNGYIHIITNLIIVILFIMFILTYEIIYFILQLILIIYMISTCIYYMHRDKKHDLIPYILLYLYYPVILLIYILCVKT